MAAAAEPPPPPACPICLQAVGERGRLARCKHELCVPCAAGLLQHRAVENKPVECPVCRAAVHALVAGTGEAGIKLRVHRVDVDLDVPGSRGCAARVRELFPHARAVVARGGRRIDLRAGDALADEALADEAAARRRVMLLLAPPSPPPPPLLALWRNLWLHRAREVAHHLVEGVPWLDVAEAARAFVTSVHPDARAGDYRDDAMGEACRRQKATRRSGRPRVVPDLQAGRGGRGVFF